LPHGLNRFDGVLGTNGPASIDGSAGSRGTARDGVGEVGGMVVHGASGPWGRPRGQMEILATRRTAGAPMGHSGRSGLPIISVQVPKMASKIPNT
jgi:hypothetical protein